VKFVSNYKIGPIFTPPLVSKPGGPLAALLSPGNQGGTNWPGGAYDPVDHLLYVFSQTTVQANALVSRTPPTSDMRYVSGRAVPGPWQRRRRGRDAAGPVAEVDAAAARGGDEGSGARHHHQAACRC
jgi:quinoprotein glucose dehydrogenase